MARDAITMITIWIVIAIGIGFTIARPTSVRHYTINLDSTNIFRSTMIRGLKMPEYAAVLTIEYSRHLAARSRLSFVVGRRQPHSIWFGLPAADILAVSSRFSFVFLGRQQPILGRQQPSQQPTSL